jgi:hypothetical protein
MSVCTHRMLWFAALWFAGVASVGLVALAIRFGLTSVR